jgi:hypothetical protein
MYNQAMNQGAVFQEDGLYKIVFKLEADGWPQVKRFSPLAAMLKALRLVSVPFDDLTDFVFKGLQSRGRLKPLPGRSRDWAQFAR